ncbi:MAG TPA: DNA adenine methylase [Candidatus Fraserbacteria bacterium]|nr:DNA adenine methylase [Candidatus Fraserbacteria bacterium]
MKGVPHPFPYQGSKRQLASQIVACIPHRTYRLIEPFVGSGAITLATAYLHRTSRFIISDLHQPLITLWHSIIYDPDQLADRYEDLWNRQQGRQREFYDEVRVLFNQTHEPHYFLYLLARCVKAAVRYNAEGQFNNSPDNRRLGMRPKTMRRNILNSSQLLRGKLQVLCQDYRETLKTADSHDVVYLDPPYQGVTNSRDRRYYSGINFQTFVRTLEDLNSRQIRFIISYDGRTGSKVHGQLLPKHLELIHKEIKVGRSAQATLLGKEDTTVESLYLSRVLIERIGAIPAALTSAFSENLFIKTCAKSNTPKRSSRRSTPSVGNAREWSLSTYSNMAALLLSR